MYTEIDENADAEAMSQEALAKYKGFAVPKGLGRISLMLMSERIGKEDRASGVRAPEPKKTINRINYRFLKMLLDTPTDSPVFMAGFKELHDRLDGKAAQAVHLGGPDGGKLTLIVGQADTNVL